MTAGITEIFTYSCTSKWSEILHCRRVRGCSCNYHCIIHSTTFTKRIDYTSHSRTFLSYSYINTVNRISCLVIRALVDDCINSNSCLSCLTVTNNQLTLSASYRNHSINSLQTSLQRFCYRLTENNSRSLTFKRHLECFSKYVATSIQWNTQRVYYTSQHTLTYIDRSDVFGTFHYHSLLNLVSRTKQDCTHIILFQIHYRTHDTVLEFQQLVSFSITQAIYTSHTITHLQHGTYLIKFKRCIYTFKLLEQYFRDLTGFYSIICHS